VLQQLHDAMITFASLQYKLQLPFLFRRFAAFTFPSFTVYIHFFFALHVYTIRNAFNLFYKDITKCFNGCYTAVGDISSLVSTRVTGVHSSIITVGSKPYPGVGRLVTVFMSYQSYSSSSAISAVWSNVKTFFRRRTIFLNKGKLFFLSIVSYYVNFLRGLKFKDIQSKHESNRPTSTNRGQSRLCHVTVSLV